MNKSYDLIIIGAGSVGVPAAMECAGNGQSVLVIDPLPSPGQGETTRQEERQVAHPEPESPPDGRRHHHDDGVERQGARETEHRPQDR